MLRKIPESLDAIVLGGGIAGCLSALKLAEAGMIVVLVEKQEDILQGASNITPGRMGLGFHYEHVDTAIAYLHATIEFVKAFPDFTIGRQDPGGYLQRGRYFIVKDSLFPAERILNTYQKIKEEYARLVEEDASNKVFGEPEDIFRILNLEEYEDDVNVDIVELGIETAECLLDWPVFRTHLIEKLNENKNLFILRNCVAQDFKYSSEGEEYVIKGLKLNSNFKTYFEVKAPFVINATWEHVEEITNRAGIMYGLPKDGRTNRLKVLAEVSLPEKLRKRNSMFFCMGPHSMFSNMDNGIGLLSYAPNTNVTSSTGVYVPPKIDIFLKEHRSKGEQEEVQEILQKEHFGEKIIEGVAKYIPNMSEAKLTGLRFGIVKTQGEVDIFDHSSAFHIRNYSGVEDMTLGWINNSAMKLLYGLNNANLVLTIIEEHKDIKSKLPLMVKEAFKQKKYQTDNIKQEAIISGLKRYFLRSELSPGKSDEIINKIVETAIIKDQANKLLFK